MKPKTIFIVDQQSCSITTALMGDLQQLSEPKPASFTGGNEMLGTTCADDAPGVSADRNYRPGMKWNWDPYGRDRCVEVKKEWSVEPLAKYLKGQVEHIDNYLTKNQYPNPERMDAWVAKLVANMQRHFKHAPKRVRHSLEKLCGQRFQKFRNFKRNEKVKTPSPEELKWLLVNLVENMLSDYTVNSDTLT